MRVSPFLWLPWWLSGKEWVCQCRSCGFEPWLRKILAEGNGNLLQYFCLENPMDRGAWRATVHGIAKSQTRLSMQACTHFLSVSGRETVTNGESSLIPVYHAFPGHLPQLAPQLFNIFLLSLAEDSDFRWWLGLWWLGFTQFS